MDKIYHLLEWHEDLVYKWIERLQMTEYQAMWVAFIKGSLMILLLQWIF